MAVQSPESEHDAEVAAALCRELRDSGHASRVSVRALRDRFGRARLTATGRAQISHALNRAGIALEPGLDQVSLDDEIVLRVVERRAFRFRWRHSLLRRGSRAWKVAVAILSLLGTLVGLYAFFEERLSKPTPHRLSGDLNLAVAPFTATADETETDAALQGEQLARQVRTTLEDQLDRRERRTGPIFDIAPPPTLEPIQGAAPEEQGAAAARSAERLGAHVLVYGTVRVGRHSTVVAPSFYISGRGLANAEELIGSHRLGAPVDVAGSVADSVAARVDARRLLAARTRTLSDFVVGLSHFERQEYAAASRWFHAAALTSSSAGGDAEEVIYLFLGHAAGRVGQLDGAQRFYAKALDAEPGYTRARFGMAEVGFQRAHGGCRPEHADEGGLRAALRGFQRVESDYQPYGSLLKVRARLGQARVLLCLGQAAIEPRWQEAETLFKGVVRAYERGEPRLRDEASEALASIALIQLPTSGEAARRLKLKRAAAYYERAFRVSLNPGRQAVFSGMLGFIYRELGRVTAAERAYRRAAQLATNERDRGRYEREQRALQGG